MGRIKCSLCLKKKQAKKSIFDLKSLLEPSVLIRPEILILPPTFQMPASSVVGLCATVEILNCYIVIWERPGERWPDIAQTIGLNCSMTHSPVKIEDNCLYFLMTFRTQIHKKNSVKMVFILWYYVSPPTNQYLKFKNHCSLLPISKICIFVSNTIAGRKQSCQI